MVIKKPFTICFTVKIPNLRTVVICGHGCAQQRDSYLPLLHQCGQIPFTSLVLRPIFRAHPQHIGITRLFTIRIGGVLVTAVCICSKLSFVVATRKIFPTRFGKYVVPAITPGGAVRADPATIAWVITKVVVWVVTVY